MVISAKISQGPLCRLVCPPGGVVSGGSLGCGVGVPGAGAVVRFEGIVRPTEENAPIAGLEYEAYEPMATRELDKLARVTAERFGLLGVWVEHSTGFVANFECSFLLVIAGRHRKESLAGMDYFIDRLKQDVPIWKKAVPVEGSSFEEGV